MNQKGVIEKDTADSTKWRRKIQATDSEPMGKGEWKKKITVYFPPPFSGTLNKSFVSVDTNTEF